MENPIKMDDLGVPLFSETSIYISGLKKHGGHFGYTIGGLSKHWFIVGNFFYLFLCREPVFNLSNMLSFGVSMLNFRGSDDESTIFFLADWSFFLNWLHGIAMSCYGVVFFLQKL